MVNLIPADPLNIQIQINPNEIQNNEIILSNNCLITPESFNFKIIDNKTLNFKYRGKIWLLSKKILFKGFKITSFNVQADISDPNKMKPVCELDYSNPINISIPLQEIDDIFIGHDNQFRKRYLMYPKLKISHNQDEEEKNYYIFFVNDDLLIDINKINIELNKWGEVLKKNIPQKISDKPIELLDEEEVIFELNDILSDEEKEISVPHVFNQNETQTKSQEIQKTNKSDVGKTTAHKKPITASPIASPIDIEEKSRPKIGRVVIESNLEDSRRRIKDRPISSVKISNKEVEEKNILYDVLKPTESTDDIYNELTNSQPDSSIYRCKKCGWILRYDQLKCPRCGSDTY